MWLYFSVTKLCAHEDQDKLRWIFLGEWATGSRPELRKQTTIKLCRKERKTRSITRLSSEWSGWGLISTVISKGLECWNSLLCLGICFSFRMIRSERQWTLERIGLGQKYSPKMITGFILLGGEWMSSVAYFEEIIFVDFQPNHMLSLWVTHCRLYVLGRPRPENHEGQANLGYVASY